LNLENIFESEKVKTILSEETQSKSTEKKKERGKDYSNDLYKTITQILRKERYHLVSAIKINEEVKEICEKLAKKIGKENETN
tara:strand:+ start:26 stop:274 length:249 start_codon:yes stop_codon:yes gene_type:complete